MAQSMYSKLVTLTKHLTLTISVKILPRVQQEWCALQQVQLCIANTLANFVTITLHIVVLATPRPACTEFDLRTTNETYQTTQGLYAIFEANAEVCINEIYVAICDLGWDDAEAQLFCDALGLKEPYFRTSDHTR